MNVRKFKSIWVLSVLFIMGISGTLHAQLVASGQLSGIATNGKFNYTLTLNNSNASTASIETFWFSWVPGADFMPNSPTAIGTPTGWTESVTHEAPGDGFAIQFVTTTAPVPPGGSLTFTFTTVSSPTTMAGDSPFFPGTPIGTSFVYAGAPLSVTSEEFVVETLLPPPPSNVTDLVSFSFTNVVQVCKTKSKIDKKTMTTNLTTTCKLSLELDVTNLGITNSPAFNVLVWSGQGTNFDSGTGSPPATEKVKALKLNKTGKIKLKDTFDTSQSGTFIFCTDTNNNVLASVPIE